MKSCIKKWKNKEAMANACTRTVPVEGAIAAFHSEVKLGPCTSVLKIVLHDIIINSVYIASLYTIFRIAHHQCKMCWNKALTFGVGLIKLSFRAIVFTQYMHSKMFSIQMLLYTFQSNCAEGLHFSAFHYVCTCIHSTHTRNIINPRHACASRARVIIIIMQ